MYENLKWREWVGLHELYETGKTSRKIEKNPYIKYLIERRYISLTTKPKGLRAEPPFCKKYENDHLEKYTHYQAFLVENDIITSNSTYTEDDIQSMMLIKENRKAIVESQDTRRGIASKFFKNSDSKHIENRLGLENAILKLLGISCFPEKDPKNNQYLCVVMCPEPTSIILCENLAFLKIPWKAKENNIELWYAGGNNLSMLADIPEDRLNKPIYYSCDWDYDGLQIYQRAKKYIPKIILLYPSATTSPKPVKTPHHNSEWNTSLPLSGLDESFYSPKAIELINTLINNDQWIEEESNHFVEMIELNNIA
ncbi:MAG: hypothetical protein OT477_06065 [Chloroflexi bacterium]|nr:hypothetical protein [Chloroflexota bacterium]